MMLSALREDLRLFAYWLPWRMARAIVRRFYGAKEALPGDGQGEERPRRYVSLTMTSKKRDERTEEFFRWTLVLSEDVAEETRMVWEGRGVSVSRSDPSGSAASERSARSRVRAHRSSGMR